MLKLHKNESEFIKKLDKFQSLLQAFTVRDIQVANTIYSWLLMNGQTIDDFKNCVDSWTLMVGLKAKGYFIDDGSIEMAQRAKQLEKTIENPELRHYVRRVRLEGVPYSRRGG